MSKKAVSAAKPLTADDTSVAACTKPAFRARIAVDTIGPLKVGSNNRVDGRNDLHAKPVREARRAKRP